MTHFQDTILETSERGGMSENGSALLVILSVGSLCFAPVSHAALNAGSLIVLKKENDSKAQTILRVINAIGTSTVAQIQTLKSISSNGGTSISILPAANDGKG